MRPLWLTHRLLPQLLAWTVGEDQLPRIILGQIVLGPNCSFTGRHLVIEPFATDVRTGRISRAGQTTAGHGEGKHGRDHHRATNENHVENRPAAGSIGGTSGTRLV